MGQRDCPGGKTLAVKMGGLNSDPQYPRKCLLGMATPCNSSIRDLDTWDPCSKVASQLHQLNILHLGSRERRCLHPQGREQVKQTPDVYFQLPMGAQHLHAYKHAHVTCKHTYARSHALHHQVLLAHWMDCPEPAEDTLYQQMGLTTFNLLLLRYLDLPQGFLTSSITRQIIKYLVYR